MISDIVWNRFKFHFAETVYAMAYFCKPLIQETDNWLKTSNYLRQGGNVFAGVCLFVCVSER